MNFRDYSPAEFSDLKGQTLHSILAVGEYGDDALHFVTETGLEYLMYHSQDCCENVQIEDVVGDLDDLIGSPILEAEVVTEDGDGQDESTMWTFYKIGTIKGHVNIRWHGSSNGYYSVSVDFDKVKSK